MQNKLQELTEKIYQEGVQKAKNEAESILANAKKEADSIIADAKSKAEEVEVEASKNAEETKRNMESEMKLASSQAISALKQQVSEMVTLNVLEPSISSVFSDKNFLQKLIEKIVSGWANSGVMDMSIILPEGDKAEMESFFKNSLSKELSKGLSVEVSDQVTSGFKVSPSDKSYIVSFSDDDFINFFKAYLRPKSIKLLFDQE